LALKAFRIIFQFLFFGINNNPTTTEPVAKPAQPKQ